MTSVQVLGVSGYAGQVIRDAFPWHASWPAYSPELFGRLIVRDDTAGEMIHTQWLLALDAEDNVSWELAPEDTAALDPAHSYSYRVEVGLNPDAPLTTVRVGNLLVYAPWSVPTS